MTRVASPVQATGAESGGVAPGFATCSLGGVEIRLHASGVALVPAEATMVAADLHLEKASAFAARGQMLPPYATLDTLRRLEALVEAFAPKRLVLLGDSFHAPIHAIGPASPAMVLIARLGARTELVWIAGNHDPAPPLDVPGRLADHWMVGEIVLRHAPKADGKHEITGHLHPTARLLTRAGSQRRSCFVHSPARLLMPAFGALTGGVDITDPSISSWFDASDTRAFLLCKDRLETVPFSALAHPLARAQPGGGKSQRGGRES